MRIPPADFWRLSLPEWRATLAGRTKRRAPALGRGDLESLIQHYPDKNHV